MKKTLIALAALAATVGAHAQSSVTLYGVVDAFVNKTENKFTQNGVTTKLSQNKVDGSGLSSSRWGLRGSEDLGGGLSAIFTLEGGFTIDNGGLANNQGNLSTSPALFGRQAWVGLKGNFGQVTLGRNYSAYDDLHGQIDHVYDSNTFAVWGPISGTGIQDYTNRPNNSIKYESPVFGGFSGKIGYGFGEDKTATVGASSNLNAQLKYANGPLVVGYAYQKEKQTGSGGTNLFGAANVVTLPTAANPSGFNSVAQAATSVADTRKYNMIGASYDFGVAKVLGAFNTAKNSAGTKDKEYQVGVNVPFGAFAVALGYAHAKSEASLANGGNNDGTGYSIVGTYDLSKRTTVYAGYLNIKSELLNGSVEVKRSLVGTGIRHTF